MRLSVRTVAIVLALGWGCTDTPLEPSADPTRLRADLAAIQTIFAAPIVRSAGFFFNVPALPAPSGPPIPDSLLGKTLAWDCAAQAYAVTAETGAPVNGVRLHLYRLAANGPIACPATLIGQLDLFDYSVAGTRALRVTATGNSGGDPFVDYTLWRDLADSSRASTANGFVSDGHERLAFQWTSGYVGEAYTTVSTTQVYDSARDFRALVEESAQHGVDTYYDDVDVTLRKNDLTLELKGSTGWFNTYSSWDEVVTVDSVFFARVWGHMTRGGPTIAPPRLTNEERQLVLDVVKTPGVLRSGLGRVLAIAQRLLNVH
jgi:hypothetical protein